jgi:hypothetical protein
MGDWGGTPQNTGSAIWTLIGTDLPSTLAIDFIAGVGFRIQDTSGATLSSPGIWHLEYTVQLLNMKQFTGVRVDSNTGGNPFGPVDTIVTKTLDYIGSVDLLPHSSTASSVNGGLSAVVTLLGKPDMLHVSETITVNEGVIVGFANSYQVVPEPTTVVASCLLLLPFAASAMRFARKNRQP